MRTDAFGKCRISPTAPWSRAGTGARSWRSLRSRCVGRRGWRAAGGTVLRTRASGLCCSATGLLPATARILLPAAARVLSPSGILPAATKVVDKVFPQTAPLLGAVFFCHRGKRGHCFPCGRKVRKRRSTVANRIPKTMKLPPMRCDREIRSSRRSKDSIAVKSGRV